MACRVGSKSEVAYSEVVEAGRIAIQRPDSDADVGRTSCVANEGSTPKCDVVGAARINFERIDSYRYVEIAGRVGGERLSGDGNVGLTGRIGRKCISPDCDAVVAGCVGTECSLSNGDILKTGGGG